jgi:hypothetical protein
MSALPWNFVDRLFFGYQNAAALKAAVELGVFTFGQPARGGKT